ncbi:hypothetical protein [Wenxinia saemankumensis]|uniref:Uncharacterized protein n=1 Tax=Wenxinia saemankumensis TaxID=1447782 RepID=A0A1M6FZQ8_9RHOB|nr:hypothetical protein [Wenxinia saemankumensis]SHJ03218.1 hypothetical protein SAMN05444417_2596 [Wenxinia saemankumensis]
MTTRLMLTLALVLGLAAPAGAQTTKLWFWGHSLVNHVSGSDETTVPHWLAHLARAERRRFAAEGMFGFLQQYAELPPEPGWSFGRVERAWRSNRLPFGEVGWDAAILSPPNFVQYQAPDRPLDWDNPDNLSPVELVSTAFGWAEAESPGVPLWLYEGWADMAEWGYPPSPRSYRDWAEYNAGPYHDWTRRLAEQVGAEIGREVGVIPTARVLARLIDGPLADLPPTELFSDDAPHGTPTMYLIAAMVVWAQIEGRPPPPDTRLPESIHPLVRDDFATISTAIWLAVTAPEAEPAAVFTAPTIAPEPEVEVEAGIEPAVLIVPDVPETGLADPALSFGLNGVNDWTAEQPFVDLMRTARPWIGHAGEEWGAWDFDALMAGGYLTAEGWPRALPEGVDALETFVLTDQDPGAVSLIGRYVVTWAGEGTLEVGGLAFDQERRGKEIAFSYVPGEGLVSIRLTALDLEDPIRDIRVFREAERELVELGEVFNPAFVRRIADARQLRFMDWMLTNGSPVTAWEDRPRMTDATWSWRGVPLEVIVRLANETGAEPWVNMPHAAEDDYVARAAQLVRDSLRADLRAWVEYSNETWNFIFPQTAHAGERARETWGEDAPEEAWMWWAGARSAEVADIWSRVFAGQEDRLVRVVGVHTGWPGLEEALLGPDGSRLDPAAHWDAYAVSGYFGHDLGSERVDELRAAIRDGGGAEWAEATLREGSVAELTGELWPHHRAVADDWGLDLVMYEGGTHVVGTGDAVEDAGLTAFFTAFNYSPRMADLYRELAAAWREIGDAPFNAFVDVATPSKWGSWGALRHLDDANPRAAALAGIAAEPWGEARDAFRHGLWIRAGSEGGRIEGTPFGDLIQAGPGDDVIVATPGDRIHGGPGRDRVILPGGPDGLSESWDGGALVLSGPWGRVRVASVGEIGFAGDDTVLTVMEDGP